MHADFLPFALPDIDEAEHRQVKAVLDSGWITTGPKTREFEAAFAAAVRAPHAVAVNSCTAALHLSLEAVGLGPGDLVLTTPYTFAATAEVVRYFDAVPVFVDVEPETFAIDPGRLAEAAAALQGGAADRFLPPALRGRGTRPGALKAVIPVHMAGRACDLDAVYGVARRHGLAVVEDAAHAFPTLYGGRPVGCPRGDGVRSAVCFSFYATKTLTTAEGGMVCTADAGLADRCRVMALHGISKDAWKRYTAQGSWYYEIVAPGYKYNLTDLAAAMGLAQLEKAERMRGRRAEIAAEYTRAFGELAELQTPTDCASPDRHAWHLYMLRLRLDRLAIDRAAFVEELKRRGIGTSVHFIPLHTHPYYREKYGYRPGDFPVALREYQREVSLPIYSKMTDADVQRVVRAVQEVATQGRRATPVAVGAVSAEAWGVGRECGRGAGFQPAMPNGRLEACPTNTGVNSPGGEVMVRRLFDVAVSAAALAVLAVPLAVIAVLVKVFSPGPVFYLQERVGKGGRPFRLYKFRTMRVAPGGPQVTADGDPRITPVGRVLRAWKLDELPQLWNVLKGDMSVIGSRPEVERFVRHYTPEQRRLLEYKPGLASLAALVYAHEPDLLRGRADTEAAYVRYLMPRKVAVDLQYERGRTLWSDLKLMTGIALAILGKNRYLDRDFRLPEESVTAATADTAVAPKEAAHGAAVAQS